MPLGIKTIEKEVNGYMFTLKINKQNTKAYLEISPKANFDFDDDEFSFPNLEDVKAFLEENNLVYGLDEEAIENMILNRKEKSSVLIAKGKEPIKGEDAQISNKMDFSKKIKLKEDSNGNIDFKSLNWFVQVVEGDILAVKVPAGDGIPGMNIFGEEIEPVKGKDINFKFGKNVKVSEDGTSLIAEKMGVVEEVEGKIVVNPVLSIDSSIDHSTGNIEFNGDVIVKGDVKPGFKVVCTGSLHVKGLLETCDIIVKNDLIVEGGIIGNGLSEITVNGNVVCKFIENANIFTLGNVTSDFIIHSNVISGGKIELNGPRSMLLGGRVVAKDYIVASFVGSTMGTSTDLVLGVDVEKEGIIKKIEGEIINDVQRLKELRPILEMGKQMLKVGTMDVIRKLSFAKSTKEYSKLLSEIKEKKDELEVLKAEYNRFRFSCLVVKDKIYPGVKVTIMGTTRYIKEFGDSCKIYLKGNEIAIEKTIN